MMTQKQNHLFALKPNMYVDAVYAVYTGKRTESDNIMVCVRFSFHNERGSAQFYYNFETHRLRVTRTSSIDFRLSGPC